MKLSFNRNSVTVLITVLFVVFLGAVYLFIYIPNNEKQIKEQRFRSLQNINSNIHDKINNSVALMNNLLPLDSTNDYIDYLNQHSKDNFVLSKPVYTKNAGQLGSVVIDSGYTIKANNETRQIILQRFRVSINAYGDTLQRLQMEMKFSAQQFFKGLLPDNVFDGYVIFVNGMPLYETVPFGADLKDTLFTKTKDLSAVRSYTISGRDYKLFLQPVSFIAHNDWAIAGLLTADRFNKERNQLPSSIILLLVTIMLVIMISLPWVKLYQMGNKDRLTLTDGIASIAVSMLLMSLLFFALFKYNTVLRPNDVGDSKTILAGQIDAAFQNELNNTYKTLETIDQQVALNKARYFIDVTSTMDPSQQSPQESIAKWRQLKYDSTFRQIFWLNKNGDEQVSWMNEERTAPHGNFRNRAYFLKVQLKKDYWLDKSHRFYLDQVISRTTGKFTSVMSIPSKMEGHVAAISFTIKNLHDPILPQGYQFAIIDKSGKVLYHSQPDRNLNENLGTEFSSASRLTSALEARTSDVFKTSYFSREYNVLVRPLKRLPYFIIIFSDLSYKATREIEIYSFTFSMLFLLFLFFLIQLLIVFLISSRRSFFKKQLFDTSWIGPKVFAHQQYNLATLFNVFVIILATLFFPVSSFLAYVFMLLFSVTFISIFLNSIFARWYRSRQQDDNYLFKINTRKWLFVLILAIDLFALLTLDLDSILLLLFYEVLLTAGGFLAYAFGDKAVKKFRSHFNFVQSFKWHYKQSFAAMALTRLIITSGIPVAFFYISAYNYEQNISIRYRQLQYANELMANLDTAKMKQITPGSFNKVFYKDDVWVKDIWLEKNGPRLIHSKEDSITSKILDLFRIKFTDLAIKEDRFSAPHAADQSFGYNPLLKDACRQNNATITYVKMPTHDAYLAVKSAGLNYKLPLQKNNRAKGLLFWLVLLLALSIFYFIVYNIIKKLFCLNLPDLSVCKELDDKIIKNNDVNNLLFVIGLPGSGKLNRILNEIKSGAITQGGNKLVYDKDNTSASNVYVADLINIPDQADAASLAAWETFTNELVFNTKNKLIVVNHFEYNIQDANTNRIKLNFLEQLMLDNKAKIIILSTIHPVAFLDSIKDANAEAVPGQDLERWHVLLGHYRIVVYPLDQKKVPEDVEYRFKSLYKETEHTHFLNKVQNCVLDIAKNEAQAGLSVYTDEIIFKLQVTSHYFYMYIWQSLTKEEKFLLYDLAEDNLVNGYDDYNLNMLLAKGVIIRRNGTLTIFNRGFRNFILTAIGNIEAMKIKRQIKDNGNWSRLKTPLLIVLAAILTFLLASQREVYSELMAYVAALAAGIPAILKFISLFDKNAEKA